MGAAIFEARIIADLAAIGECYGLFRIEMGGKGGGVGLFHALAQRRGNQIKYAQHPGRILDLTGMGCKRWMEMDGIEYADEEVSPQYDGCSHPQAVAGNLAPRRS